LRTGLATGVPFIGILGEPARKPARQGGQATCLGASAQGSLLRFRVSAGDRPWL